MSLRRSSSIAGGAFILLVVLFALPADAQDRGRVTGRVLASRQTAIEFRLSFAP